MLFKKLSDLEIGSRGSYLDDYWRWPLKRVMELPEGVARAWFDVHGLTPYPLKYNKEWMVVGESVEMESWLIIYNLDGALILYTVSYADE